MYVRWRVSGNLFYILLLFVGSRTYDSHYILSATTTLRSASCYSLPSPSVSLAFTLSGRRSDHGRDDLKETRGIVILLVLELEGPSAV